MSPYYYFHNTRLNLDNTKALNGTSRYMCLYGDNEAIEYYFNKVLELNNDWLPTDRNIAQCLHNGFPSLESNNGVIKYRIC